MTKGKSLRGRYLVITGRVSIILIILRRRGYGMLWRGWRSKASHASLFVGNATGLGVHRTHLICEIVKTTTKVSLYLLKLHHDGLKGHTTNYGGRRSRGRGWNSRSCKIGHLHSWLLPLKLGLASLGKTNADGTRDGEERRERGMGMEKRWRIRVIAEEKMSLSWVAVSWYTFRIDMMKWEGKSMERPSIKEKRKWARGLVMEL